MRPIAKRLEPPELAVWKASGTEEWQPSWEDLRAPVKPVVLAQLVEEQGAVCCYCEQRIGAASAHIEHLVPRREAPSRALDYANLLASCQGELPRAPVHCGHLKADKPLPVHPLLPDCRECFEFDSAGGVRPGPLRPEDAARSIKVLGLDAPKLAAMRRKALMALDDLLAADDEAELQRFRDHLDDRDEQGQFLPFATALASVLDQYLPARARLELPQH